jgi:phosphatidylserine/phosphatidylglycerophosphate/cardiolipin synthase-like enzyme
MSKMRKSTIRVKSFPFPIFSVILFMFLSPPIAHNKVIIIDGETVITGSFNFTKAAEENNAENLLVIHDKKLAERYTKNWDEHAKHSEVYAGRGK